MGILSKMFTAAVTGYDRGLGNLENSREKLLFSISYGQREPAGNSRSYLFIFPS